MRLLKGPLYGLRAKLEPIEEMIPNKRRTSHV